MKEHGLQQALAAGVWMEFQNRAGTVLAYHVEEDWRGRPLPAVGDSVTFQFQPNSGKARQKLKGVVRSRHFEIQQTSEHESAVWARLVVEVDAARAACHASSQSSSAHAWN